MLEYNSFPLYHRLREFLLEKIESGEWQPGHQLPGEHQLTAEFGISRATVRQALQLLESQGRIERRQGKGTFVARPKFAYNLLSRRMESATRFQLHAMVKKTPPLNVVERLNLAANDQVWELRRTVLADAEPIFLVTSWLPVATFPDLDTQDFQNAMHRILTRAYGIYTARQYKEVEVAALDDEEARLLQTRAGAPALLVSYVNYSAKREPYEYRKMLVRGDRSKYYVDVDFPEVLI
jgi:GntR family transcriptional regulator